MAASKAAQVLGAASVSKRASKLYGPAVILSSVMFFVLFWLGESGHGKRL